MPNTASSVRWNNRLRELAVCFYEDLIFNPVSGGSDASDRAGGEVEIKSYDIDSKHSGWSTSRSVSDEVIARYRRVASLKVALFDGLRFAALDRADRQQMTRLIGDLEEQMHYFRRQGKELNNPKVHRRSVVAVAERRFLADGYVQGPTGSISRAS